MGKQSIDHTGHIMHTLAKGGSAHQQRKHGGNMAVGVAVGLTAHIVFSWQTFAIGKDPGCRQSERLASFPQRSFGCASKAGCFPYVSLLVKTFMLSFSHTS